MSEIKYYIKSLAIRFLDISFSSLRSYYFRRNVKDLCENSVGNEFKVNNGNLDIYIRKGTSDEDVYFQIFIEEEYRFLVELAKYYVNKTDVSIVMDVGANIGLTSLYLSSFFEIRNVYAIEPDRSNFRQLELNLTTNKMKFLAINKPLWSRIAPLEFKRFRDGRAWSISLMESDSSGLNSIISTCFDDVINENNISVIDILKIDIEGSEKILLRDSDQFIKVLKITKILAIEIHDEVVSRIEFTEFIQSLGFKIYAKGETLYAVNTILTR